MLKILPRNGEQKSGETKFGCLLITYIRSLYKYEHLNIEVLLYLLSAQGWLKSTKVFSAFTFLLPLYRFHAVPIHNKGTLLSHGLSGSTIYLKT